MARIQSNAAREPLSFTARPDDPRWTLVQRIADSAILNRSALLVNFLLFVCDRYLMDRASEITEKQIGFHVFGRSEGYSASDDNIVRNYARMLRKRLKEYFATEGANEEMTVFIPRGGYVPVFTSRQSGSTIALEHSIGFADDQARDALAGASSVAPDVAGTLIPSSGVEDSPEPRSDDSPAPTDEEKQVPSVPSILTAGVRSWQVLLAISTVILSALAGYFGSRQFQPLRFPSETRAATLNQNFWGHIFERQRDTFVVPGDGGLVMLQSFIREHVSLEDYASGNYRKESQIAQGIVGLTTTRNPNDNALLLRKVEALGNRRYTSIADLDLTAHLSRLPEVIPERLMIRYARDLRIDDLRSGNAILIGSIEANPWVDLFQQQLNFRFFHGADFGGSGIIRNLRPMAGEHVSYASEPNDPLQRTYGLIAYVPNLNGSGHVLMIEGVNMAGTQAAGEFVLDPNQMQPILERAMAQKNIIRPFEVLIETDNIASNPSRPHVLSERIGQP